MIIINLNDITKTNGKILQYYNIGVLKKFISLKFDARFFLIRKISLCGNLKLCIKKNLFKNLVTISCKSWNLCISKEK